MFRVKARCCPSERREVELEDMEEKKGMVDREDTLQSFIDKHQDIIKE